MKRKPPTGKKSLRLAGKTSAPDVGAVPASYAALLTEIKERVRNAQLRAHLAVNRELVLLYWQIGRDIVSRQKLEGWGKSVIERLAADIQREFPGIEGFSPLNLWRMRSFYLAYTEVNKFLSPPVTESGSGTRGSSKTIILSPPVTELGAATPTTATEPNLAQAAQDLPTPEVLAIPWSHNLILIQK